MTDSQEETDAAERSDAQHGKKFAAANGLIMLVFILGDLLAPQYLLQGHPDVYRGFIFMLLMGAWAAQAATMGIYAAFTNQFFFERLTWPSIGLTVCVFSILSGLQFALEKTTKLTMEPDLAAFIACIAFASASLIFVVGLGFRVYMNIRLAKKMEARLSEKPNFGIAFLFRLTIAIALLMLAWKLTPIQFNSTVGIGPYAVFVPIILMTFVIVLTLIGAVFQASLAVARRRIGFVLILILLCLGTPLLVFISRIQLPPIRISFWYQLYHFFGFLTGFVVSLFIVCEIWRHTGLRLVRLSQVRD